MVGDSAAAGVGAPSQDEALVGHLTRALATDGPLVWRLVARTGATAAGTRRHLAKLAPDAPERLDGPFDVAVTFLGLNDVLAGSTPDAVLREIGDVVELLRVRFGVRHVVLSGVPAVGAFPSLPNPLRGYLGRRARTLDAAVRAWAATQTDCEHLPLEFAFDPAAMAADGFHPGRAMYAAWASAIATRVRAWRESAVGGRQRDNGAGVSR